MRFNNRKNDKQNLKIRSLYYWTPIYFLAFVVVKAKLMVMSLSRQCKMFLCWQVVKVCFLLLFLSSMYCLFKLKILKTRWPEQEFFYHSISKWSNMKLLKNIVKLSHIQTVDKTLNKT